MPACALLVLVTHPAMLGSFSWAALVLVARHVLAYSPPLHRISPPRNALVVRVNTTRAGEYSTITSAIWALPNDTSSQSIFIYPGTYHEQAGLSGHAHKALTDESFAKVYLSRPGPVTVNLFLYASDGHATDAFQLYGYTRNTGLQEANEVIITNSLVASAAGSDEASGTLRVHTNNTQVYNINIRSNP